MQSKLFKSQVGNCFQPNLVQEDQIYHLSLFFFWEGGRADGVKFISFGLRRNTRVHVT